MREYLLVEFQRLGEVTPRSLFAALTAHGNAIPYRDSSCWLFLSFVTRISLCVHWQGKAELSGLVRGEMGKEEVTS